MKKLRNTILLLITVFFIGITGVDAAAVGYGCGYQELTPSAVPVRTYIIGTHMFTRETNADYPGYLTTKLIMMGSRTIDSDEELIIYYKTPSGAWINSLDGSSIKPKNSFVIERVNTRFDENTLCSPYLSMHFDKDLYISGNKSFELYYEKQLEIEVGIEIYRSEEYDGEYTLYETISEEEYDEWEPVVGEVERGKQYYYKARFFKAYSDKTMYSEFSYPEYLDNTDIRLYLEKTLIDFEGNKVAKLEVDVPDAAEEVTIYNSTYECDEEDCWPVLDDVDTFQKEEFDNIYIDVPVGTEYELVAESYSDDYYFESSNSVMLFNAYPSVQLSTSFIESNEDNYTYELSIDEELALSTSMKIYYREADTTAGFTFLKEVTENKVNVDVPIGKTYIFKVVLNDTDTQVEGISSNEVTCYTTLQTPNLGYSYSEEGYTLEVTPVAFVDKIEVYSSETENGKYKLLSEITIDELEELGLYEGQGSASIPLYLLPGAKLYFKVKTVGTINGETKTSELSNWTLIDNVPHEFEYEYDSTDIYNNANYLLSVDDNYANGIEVYYAEEDIEDSYQLLTSSETTETMIKIPEGKSYYIKVRTYTIYGDGKEYSDFLPAELLENEYSIILEESFDSYSDETYLYDLYLGFDSYDAYFDYSATIGMELYCSSTKDGEYTKVDDVYDEYDVYVEVPEGEERYCYVKTYEKLDGEKQYGVTTNTVTLHPFSREALEIDLIDIYDYEDYSGVELTFKNDVVGPFEGIELYTSATVDGTYKAISILEGWYTSGQQFFEVETQDINKFYKVRTFIYDGEEKIYSEYSNAIEFKFDEIELSIMFAGCTSDDSCYYGIWAQNANEDTNYTLDGKNMLVYVKTADSNEFELLDDVRGDSYEIASSNIEGNTYKVKMYVGTKENGVYSDWSNEVTKVVEEESFLGIPTLNVDPQGEGEPGSYVYDLYINYGDYIVDETDENSGYMIDGWELYLDYTVEGKDYIEVDGTNYTMVADHTEFGVVPRDYIWGSGESYNYIARAYYYDGEEKVYTDWSEVLTVDAEVLGIIDEPTE